MAKSKHKGYSQMHWQLVGAEHNGVTLSITDVLIFGFILNRCKDRDRELASYRISASYIHEGTTLALSTIKTSISALRKAGLIRVTKDTVIEKGVAQKINRIWPERSYIQVNTEAENRPTPKAENRTPGGRKSDSVGGSEADNRTYEGGSEADNRTQEKHCSNVKPVSNEKPGGDGDAPPTTSTTTEEIDVNSQDSNILDSTNPTSTDIVIHSTKTITEKIEINGIDAEIPVTYLQDDLVFNVPQLQELPSTIPTGYGNQFLTTQYTELNTAFSDGMNALLRTQSTILFYGQSGCGKTAYVKALAASSVKNESTMLSPKTQYPVTADVLALLVNDEFCSKPTSAEAVAKLDCMFHLAASGDTVRDKAITTLVKYDGLLILDDVLVNTANLSAKDAKFLKGAIQQIVKARYDQHKRTILITTMHPLDIQAQYGDEVSTRLAARVHCVGPNLRRKHAVTHR